MTYNFTNPDSEEQETILAYIRGLSMDEVEALFGQLRQEGIITFPLPDDDNERRRKQRHRIYIQEIKRICHPYFSALTPVTRVCDIGCGDGEIAVAVFADFLQNGAELYGCDVVSYLTPGAKQVVSFEQTTGIEYLSKQPEGSFDCVMEVVALHHLASKQLYRDTAREMIRATRSRGLVVFVETVHNSWNEHLSNAVLDILLNDRTSRHITGSATRAIPVPVQFLSETELDEEIKQNGARIVHKAPMEQTAADPKKHIVYICEKL